MGFTKCLNTHNYVLMEGALGERLKREYELKFDENVAMANLVHNINGVKALKALWHEYIDIAERYKIPFLATTPTRRANKERIVLAGYDATLIHDNVLLLRSIQQESNLEMYIGGLIGCKGNAYTGEEALSEREAYEFHLWQAENLALGGVDFLYAGIMPNVFEAAGMAQAMAETGLPYIISFTIQRDGKLIDGTKISDAINYIDRVTAVKPICYMTNCVHPTILYEALSQPFNDCQLIEERFWGIQANTSPLSYAELDNSIDLKCSQPNKFANEMIKLKDFSGMKIFGGCCGTDNRHMEELARRL